MQISFLENIKDKKKEKEMIWQSFLRLCMSAFDIHSFPALASSLCRDVHLRTVINSAYLCHDVEINGNLAHKAI